MSDWATESKKPIPGKIGKLIDKSRNDNVLAPSKMLSESKRIADTCKEIISNELILKEIEKLDDFANSWADDMKYMKYDKKTRKLNHVKVKGFFDVNIDGFEKSHIWSKGYHQAVRDLHDRITKLELLYRVHLLQNTVKELGSGGKSDA